MKLSMIIFLFFSFYSLAIQAKGLNECLITKAGLDIGSGSTKLLIAKVDICQKLIKETILSESRAVNYNESFLKDKEGLLDEKILKEGELVLFDYMEKIKKLKVKNIEAIATSVFRKANNGEEALKFLNKKTKLKIRLINQDEEALLGFWSVANQVSRNEFPLETICVWDIGGGSMQMTYYDEKKAIIYRGDLASISFKNMIIEGLQLKNPDLINSPNPIDEVKNQAVALARSYGKIHLSSQLKKKTTAMNVFGIGGVFNFSLKKPMQIKDDLISIEQLKKYADTMSKKTDEEITGDYKSTDVSNILLVQGFMEAMNLNTVNVKNASLLEGLLLKTKN